MAGGCRAAVARLRARAHVHTASCYGSYEPCGEHHQHDDRCGGRPLICQQREEPDLQLLFDRTGRKVDQLAERADAITAKGGR